MYHIGICDDEPHVQEALQTMAGEIMEELGIPFSCSVYGSAEELYQAVSEEKGRPNVILLDILLAEGESGMELAQRLRREQNDIGIVFITSSVDYVLKGYDVQAIKYIIKPVDRTELKKALWYDYSNHYRQQYLTVLQNRHQVSLRICDIVFAEIDGKGTAVHMKNGAVILSRERIRDMERALPAGSFCFCHRSFLINLDHVVEIVRYEARMTEGSVVPISKNYFKETQEAFLHHMASRLF